MLLKRNNILSQLFKVLKLNIIIRFSYYYYRAEFAVVEDQKSCETY